MFVSDNFFFFFFFFENVKNHDIKLNVHGAATRTAIEFSLDRDLKGSGPTLEPLAAKC